MSTQKFAGIATLTTAASVALIWWANRYFVSSGSPEWLQIVLVLIAVIGAVSAVFTLMVGYLLIRDEALHAVVMRYGIRTTSTVVRSFRCKDPEDVCLCGSYRFADARRKDHEFKFKICMHWPSNEQWKLVEQGYTEGAQNPVYYLRYFPFIHEVQFPI